MRILYRYNPSPIIIDECGIEFSINGTEAYPTTKYIDLSSDNGTTNFDYFAANNPDLFLVYYNEDLVINTGYVGNADQFNIGSIGFGRMFFNASLTGKIDPVNGGTYPSNPILDGIEADGYPTVTDGTIKLTTNFIKETAPSNIATVNVYSPMGSVFQFTLFCPVPLVPCFGYLYNWYAVDDSRELTSGVEWSVPTATQFTDMINYALTISGGDVAILREEGTSRWVCGDGTNVLGFSAIGSGERASSSGNFGGLETGFSIWTSTASGPPGAYMKMGVTCTTPYQIADDQKTGSAIRLVKDATGLADGVTTTYTGNDGKTYNAIVINELYWTTENLEETEYRNGDVIPVTQNNTTWAALPYGSLCLYDNDLNNACKFPTPSSDITFDISNKGICGETPSSSIQSNADAMTFNNDGTMLYFVGSAVSVPDEISQGTLSTPWDLTTYVETASISIGVVESRSTDIDFSDNGVYMYITGWGTDKIHQYTLSTPWDITTAVFTQDKSIGSISNVNRTCTFASNGNIVYLATEGSGNSFVYKCNLSTPWDISTLTYSGENFNFNAGDSRVWGFDISPDGLNVLVSGVGEGRIGQFFLSTPFDITTATFYTRFTQSGTAYDVQWKPDGTKFFGYAVNDAVKCYTVE